MGEQAMTDLLTKAVGDIAAALALGGHESKIAEWVAPYVAAINQADDGSNAEAEFRRSQIAMDASTLGGRGRTSAARERLRRAKKALEGQTHAG